MERPKAHRKRPRSSSDLPSDTINPLSRSQRQLQQFAVAGLGETDPDPAAADPLFPHRGSRHGPLLSRDGDEDEDGGKKPRLSGTSQMDKHVQTLLESVYQFLDGGDMGKAARAYGIILQLQPGGHPVDIRRHHLWAIGAEILMREGELPPGSEDSATAESNRRRQRWGSAANMSKVKAYFETLIQQHPWDHRRPNTICALDFWLAQLRCEIYNVQAEHRIALQSLEDDPPSIDVEMDDTLDPSTFSSTQELMEERGAAARDRLRQQAFAATRDIAYRMSRLMQDQPYSGNLQFQQLLLTVSSYMDDLEASLTPSTSHVAQKSRR